MTPEELVEKDAEKVFKENSLFSEEMLLLEKNDNNSLMQKVLPCNEDFFNTLFNTVFWELNCELGFAEKPFDCNYLNIIGNEFFFNKNTEERFLKNIGLEKKFVFSNEKILEKTAISVQNIIFLAAMPFEIAKNASTLSIAAFKINNELRSFEEHYEKSLSFWKKNRIINNAVPLSYQAMAGALQSMRYSLLSSIAFSLKIRLKQCFATKRNLMKEMALMPLAVTENEMKDLAGYFSLTPYDISKPFLEENIFFSDFLKKMPFPVSPHYILRENAKLCCSMYLSVLRKCFLSISDLKEMQRDIFYLKQSELQLAVSEPKEAESLLQKRKIEFEENAKILLPNRIAFEKGKIFFEKEKPEPEVYGISVGSKAVVEGRIVFAENTKDIGKILDGDIIFSKNFSPELVVGFGKSIGIISLSGSMLSHCAIVAREKGIPCIVQLKGSHRLKEGIRIRADGNTGKITILFE